ncbi:hypothetical protein BJ165DRAFT_930771 [Panaeolus papilionaceus]|nr:hypothetical protein BJ165DRAFT_930771 [Panaeolus papilionaceus]
MQAPSIKMPPPPPNLNNGKSINTDTLVLCLSILPSDGATMVPDSTVDLTAIPVISTLQVAVNRLGGHKVSLPYDLLWKIFVDFVIPDEPDGAKVKLVEFIKLPSVCKGWAIVLKQLLFKYVTIGHESWPRKQGEMYASLMDSRGLGSTIRHCIRVLRWSVSSSSTVSRNNRMRRHITMRDYIYIRLPNLSTVHVVGKLPRCIVRRSRRIVKCSHSFDTIFNLVYLRH